MPRRFFDGVDTWVGYNGDSIPVIIDDPTPFALGFPIFSSADISVWNTGQDKYIDLRDSTLGDVSRTITDLGTGITTTTERDRFRVDCQFALIQAILGQADPTTRTARWAKVQEVINACDTVTSYTSQSGQDNLVAGWFIPSLCAAAKIIGYQPGDNSGFEYFLRNVVHPMLDWTTGGNWFLSFWDARGCIAALLKDETLWADFRAYGLFHLPQVWYHPTYDGLEVTPCRNGVWPAKAAGSINTTRTVVQWGNVSGSLPLIDTSLVAEWDPGSPSNGTPFPPGMNCEELRDISHITFSCAAAVHALMTIEAQNDDVSADEYERVLEGCNRHATKVLNYINSGFTTISPTPVGGSGGGGYRFGWAPIKRYFRSDANADVDTLMGLSHIVDFDVDGDLHMVAEMVAYRSI